MTVSNEAIIAALLQSGTVKEAATAAGISARTIHDRMKNDEFKIEYAEAKNNVLRRAVNTMSDKLTAAVETVAEIMENPANNPAVRLQAAQTIIGNAAKLSEKLTQDEEQAAKIGRTIIDELDEMFK